MNNLKRTTVLLCAFCVFIAKGDEMLGRLTDLSQAEFKVETNGVKYLEIAATRLSMAKTDFVPVTPGVTYRLKVHRHGPAVQNIDVEVLLYDEDLHLLYEGCYPQEWKIRGLTFYSNWPNDFPHGREMTMPAEARFVRLVVASGGIARIDSLAWDKVGGTPLVVKPLPESPYEIVIPKRASEPIALAASELRHWIRRISGKRAQLVDAASSPRQNGKTRIYLGHDFLPVDTGRNDSWKITKKDGAIYLTANRDTGVCNAVYDLLERNTDIIFARNERIPGGVVFTPNPNLAFTNCESHVEPKFAHREFGFVGLHFDPPTQLWCRRNYLNHRGAYYAKHHILSSGMTMFRKELSYEIGGLIPNDRYFKAHPEFYGMREGTRRAYEHYGVQPCYTSAAGQREMAKNLVANIRRDFVPGVEGVSIGYGDTWDLCRCPDCIRDVKLPSGRILKEDDRGFRSRQYFQLAFVLAAAVHEAFPQLEVNSLGYLYAAEPPPELPFPNYYSVTYCPYPKCCSVPVYDDTKNRQWHERSELWGKSGALMNIYEYYGDAIAWPRPGCDNAAKDMAYWNRLGISNLMYCEMPPDNRGAATNNKGSGFAAAWDLSAMENWVMARLFVDPTRDAQALRREYCRRAYRGAAGEMLAFYAKIHEQWRKAPYKGWGEDPVASMNQDIRKAGLEKPLRELLVKAQAKADHPASKQLIGQALAEWDRLVALAEKAQPPPQEIPYAKVAADALPGADDVLWSKVYVVTNFTLRTVHGVTNLGVRTEARAFHDNRFLYVRFDCEGVPEGGSRGARALPNETAASTVQIPRDGDSVAVFIRLGAKGLAHTVYRAYPDGTGYDARNYDGAWRADGFATAAAATPQGWRAVLKIPLAAAEVNPTVPGERFLNFVRSTGCGGAWRSCTSSGARPHDAGAYKPYVIEAK